VEDTRYPAGLVTLVSQTSPFVNDQDAERTYSQMVSSTLISRSAPQPAMMTTARGGTVGPLCERDSERRVKETKLGRKREGFTYRKWQG
jgi:hypothetical protein